jgi:hypothetical protein
MDGVPAAEAGALAAGVVAAGVFAADGLLDELEHAAASNAIGTTAVAVQTNRILLATSGHSFFTKSTLKRAVAIPHAGACEQTDRGAPRSGITMNRRLSQTGQ